MATEEGEISNGWPLGLEIMSMRLRLPERLQAARSVESLAFHMPSSSFSSFSSSNLDTESSASFFQDHSVSLGRLIGFRPRDGGRGALYFRNMEERNRVPATARGASRCRDVSRGGSVDMSQGICIPLILGALVKTRINRNRSKVKAI